LAPEALRIDGLEAYYGDSHVLHGLSFALRAGEVLALLGRNGAGKTTCISSIMGLLPPRAGRIALFGRPIAGLPPETISRAGVGLVPQGRRVFPSLSVRENLDIARQREQTTGRPWSLDRIWQLFPQLAERKRQLAGSLSGGEQQMLAIGRALMGNPGVLLMDEPSEGLAPLIVAEVGRTIGKLKTDGQSILLVEQNSRLAMSLADHVVILNTGRVVFDDRVEEATADEDLIAQNLGVYQSSCAA
jgi:branched-chain amino acid transport system ATP-binding protein